jgi:propionyl-CoA carboxylase beta chain
VVKTVTHEDVTQEQLGGAKTHTSKSGVAHLAADNDIELLRVAREFYSFLPLNNESGVPHRVTSDPRDRKPMGLDTLVPLDPNTPYDIRQVIEVLLSSLPFPLIQWCWSLMIVSAGV